MLITFAVLMVAHFVADFPLQSREMAIQKSQDWRVLLKHVLIHGAVFEAVGLLLFDTYVQTFVLAATVVVTHAVIDWNVWRGYKRYATKRAVQEMAAAPPSDVKVVIHPEYRFWEDHWFWVTVGADQLLHGLSIVLALYLKGLV